MTKVWFGVNVANLTELPQIEAVGCLLLPSMDNAYIANIDKRKVDGDYVFWYLDEERADAIDYMLKKKLARMRTLKRLTLVGALPVVKGEGVFNKEFWV